MRIAAKKRMEHLVYGQAALFCSYSLVILVLNPGFGALYFLDHEIPQGGGCCLGRVQPACSGWAEMVTEYCAPLWGIAD